MVVAVAPPPTAASGALLGRSGGPARLISHTHPVPVAGVLTGHPRGAFGAGATELAALAAGHAEELGTGASEVVTDHPLGAFLPWAAHIVLVPTGPADQQAAAEVLATRPLNAFLARATWPISQAALGHAFIALAPLRHPRLAALACLAAGLEAAATAEAAPGVRVACPAVGTGVAGAALLTLSATVAALAAALTDQPLGVAAVSGAARLVGPAAGLADASFANQPGAVAEIPRATDHPRPAAGGAGAAATEGAGPTAVAGAARLAALTAPLAQAVSAAAEASAAVGVGSATAGAVAGQLPIAPASAVLEADPGAAGGLLAARLTIVALPGAGLDGWRAAGGGKQGRNDCAEEPTARGSGTASESVETRIVHPPENLPAPRPPYGRPHVTIGRERGLHHPWWWGCGRHRPHAAARRL